MHEVHDFAHEQPSSAPRGRKIQRGQRRGASAHAFASSGVGALADAAVAAGEALHQIRSGEKRARSESVEGAGTDAADESMADVTGPAGTDETLYCVCRSPYDPSRNMVCCDTCDGWFHLDCVGITDAAQAQENEYICPLCTRLCDCKLVELSKNYVSSQKYSMLLAHRTDSAALPCLYPSCTEPRRKKSKYCSDLCGLLTAQIVYRTVVEPRDSKPNTAVAKCVAEEIPNPTQARAFGSHIEHCYIKIENQLLHGVPQPVMDDENDGIVVFCGAYDSRSQLYCRMFRETCPFHSPRKEQTTTGVCHCPLPSGGTCLLPKKTCCQHYAWEWIRKTEIIQETYVQQQKIEGCKQDEALVRARIARRVRPSVAAAAVPDSTNNPPPRPSTSSSSSLDVITSALASSSASTAAPALATLTATTGGSLPASASAQLSLSSADVIAAAAARASKH